MSNPGNHGILLSNTPVADYFAYFWKGHVSTKRFNLKIMKVNKIIDLTITLWYNIAVWFDWGKFG